ncbi:glycosyltransferase family 87 protein [Alloyangia pacifica]|uniref:glycosyltransferase family 87 protein n=1 Tax=Alloyangia pacifica TaxID=311180 RepID=UPI001CFE8E62|nr:glycosyltransferase family 87 protein [Alloyangia pacifica]
MLISFAVLIIITTVRFAAPDLLGVKLPFLDFHVFHLVGEYVWQGNVADAYDYKVFRAEQSRLAGADNFMPWAYPAQFNLFIAPLALLDVWMSYLIFTSATLWGYLYILRKLDADNFSSALVFSFPAIVITILCGQNGFLTASLIGAFCLLALKNRRSSGVPLGLMAFKPHLAVGLAIAALLRRNVAVLGIAAAMTVFAVAAASFAFGADIWNAVRESAQASSSFLRKGYFQLHRITSAYAFLRSLGLEAQLALGGQLVVALVALGGVVWAHLQGWQTRRVLGVAVLATFAVSPYNYDYDLSGLAVALTLLMPDVARYANAAERAALGLGCWLATGWGLMNSLLEGTLKEVDILSEEASIVSLGAVFYLMAAIVLFLLAARAEQRTSMVPTVAS